MSKHKHLGKVKRTDRGYDLIEFGDYNDVPCQVQQSSAVGFDGKEMRLPGTSFLWVGRETGRMHLSREHVSELVEVMQRWLYTGKLSE
jgi:hypothetical protein